MSNVIPIVSSSPPPLDDDEDLGWNDDDDEFGNFASAPHEPFDVVTSTISNNSLLNDKLDPNQRLEVSELAVEVGNTDKNSLDICDNDLALGISKDETSHSCQDEFPAFAEFHNHLNDNVISDNICLVNKLSDCESKLEADICDSDLDVLDSNVSEQKEKLTGDKDSSMMLNNNESVYSNTSTIDSGIFSSDLSPSYHTSTLYQSTESTAFSHLEKQQDPCNNVSSTDFSPTVVQEDCNSFTEQEEEDEWSDFNTAIDLKSKPDVFIEQELKKERSSQDIETVNSQEIVPVNICDENKTAVSLAPADDFELENASAEKQKGLSLVVSDIYFSDKAAEIIPESSSMEQDNIQAKVCDRSFNLDEEQASDNASENFDDSNRHSQDDLDLTKTAHGSHVISDDSGLAESSRNTDNKLPGTTVDEEDSVYDGEFGSFNTTGDKSDGDPHKEVSPIMFRTSVCESEEDPPLDEFSFTKPADLGDTASLDNFEGDDFGDFDVAKDVKESDDEEFGDFGPAAKPDDCNKAMNQTEPGQRDDDGDWADFSESSPAQNSVLPENKPATETSSFKPFNSNENKAQKLEKVVINCFPSASELGDMQAKPSQQDATEDNDCKTSLGSSDQTTLETIVELGMLNPLEAKQHSWTVVQHPSKKDPKVKLWSGLKDLDSSHALLYSWSSSHCSQEVYLTLHIDTQNVLFTQKKQAVPFFAAGLSILEPIRGVADSKNNRHNISSTPTLLDTNRSDQPQNVTTVQDIPPVDFDWSSSGLTNPLTANTLDLDFLVVQGGESCERTSDEWDWVFKSESQESTRSSLQPLEDILKKSTPTAKLTTTETLSVEALRILEKMPDLSFMHSRVLMFPVKQ